MRAKKRVNCPEKPSNEYLNGLKIKDFLGRLSETEVKIAKKFNCYKWDAWAKNRSENPFSTQGWKSAYNR